MHLYVYVNSWKTDDTLSMAYDMGKFNNEDWLKTDYYKMYMLNYNGKVPVFDGTS